MWTDKYRGTRGLLGWLIMKWDVYQLRRMVREAKFVRDVLGGGYRNVRK